MKATARRTAAHPGARTPRVARGATALVAVVAMTLALSTVAAAKPAPQPTPAGSLSDTAAAQIAALQKIKISLTPTERKLDSRLAIAVRQRASKSATSALPKLDLGITASARGTDVDIQVTSVSADLLSRIRSVGGAVRYASKSLRSVRATAPIAVLTTIAGWKDVVRVHAAMGAMTDRESVRGQKPTVVETKQERAVRRDGEIRSTLARALAGSTGVIVSEGDKAHAADLARTRFTVTGTGVKVCALSNGVDSLQASISAGELPADTDVLPGQEGSGDEGTAMLEIVHDLAPNAKLEFATAFTSEASFAENIRALRSQAGCDIIVDDVLYLDESPFQDGLVAQAVNAVTANGALYFSSAGNWGNTLDGTSGSYETDFVDSGQGVAKFAGQAHDFDPGPGVQVFEPISDASNNGIPVTLFWADPLGAAADDYDLYLLDAAGNVLGLSQDVQNGDDDPFEILGTPDFGGSGLRLAVVKFSGADRYFQLSALQGRFSDSADGLVARVSPGVTRGHSAAVNAFSTAAAPASVPLPFQLEPGDPPNPSGPFPGVFTRRQAPERFTSDGPRRIFFRANGSAVTPGNFSSTGGTVRVKPNITAADGVRTSVPGFDQLEPFFGTSAAASHAAAIAALVLSGNPGGDTALLRRAFNATALDLAPSAVDARSGHGLILATRVLANTGATPQPLVVPGTPTVTPKMGDGDPYLEPGETATLAQPADNTGDGRATGVSVRVTSSDPLVTVTPESQSYGGIDAGASQSKDFTLGLDPSYPLGKRAALAVTVTFAGLLSPTHTTVLVKTGHPAPSATTFAYSGPPVPIPDADSAGASVSIPVAGIGYAARLTFSVDGDTCTTDEASTTVGIDHTFVGDLVGTLTSPSGSSALLFARDGLSGNNLCQVVFDDTAARSISSALSTEAPFTGSWQPLSPLSDLISAPVAGAWTFTAADLAGEDIGSIRALSLHITGFVP